MSIASINSNTPPGVPLRPATELPAADVRQAKAEMHSSSVSAITEQSVSQAQKAEVTREQLQQAAKEINDFIKPINNSLEFQLDDATGKTVVRVIDIATEEVIRQIPSEEMLAIAKAIDQMKGLLVHQKA